MNKFSHFSFIHLLFHSFVFSFIHSFIYSLNHSFIHSFIHSFVHLSIKSFIHSFIHLSIQFHLIHHSTIQYFVRLYNHFFNPFIHTHSFCFNSRFYFKVNLDGHDLRTLNLKWLRQNIGVVSQEPVLFDMTIAENIKFGSTDVGDNITQAKVEEAAKMANAHEFIMKLPNVRNQLLL